MMKFDQVWLVFWHWCCRRNWILVKILKLGLVKILKLKFYGEADVWLKFWRWCLVEILKMKFDQDLYLNLWYDSIGYFGKMNSTLGSVVPLAMFLLYLHHFLSLPFFKWWICSTIYSACMFWINHVFGIILSPQVFNLSCKHNVTSIPCNPCILNSTYTNICLLKLMGTWSESFQCI